MTPLAELTAARVTLVAHGRRMVAEQLVLGSAGNLSIRLGDEVLITPSGVDYDLITEDDLCLMDPGGGQSEGAGRPSSEYPMHRAIYDATSAGAVVHTHSTAAVTVSALCDEIPAIHYAILRLGGPTVRVASYQTFGSDDLAASARAALEGRSAALLQNHGVIAYGDTLPEAYARAQLVEWLAEVWWRAQVAGSPRILSEEELAGVSAQGERLRYRGARA